MKIKEIAKRVGSSIVKELVPGGGLIVDLINEFMPDDKKLPKTATGDDINAAIESLPPEQKAIVLAKEFDVEITQIKESNETVRTMLETDLASSHTTRPYIAKGAFQVVAACCLAIVATWCGAIWRGDVDSIKAVQDGAQFVMFLIGPLVTLLWAYFGILKTEHRDKLGALSGSPVTSGIMGVISSLITRK